MDEQYKHRVERQFCSFCIKVLKNEARNILKEYARNRTREKSFSCLTNAETELLSVNDTYFQGNHVFSILNEYISVTDDILARALEQLTDDKRNIILLFYFLGFTDSEIGRQTNTLRQTVSYRRSKTLAELKNILEKEGYEWSE